jgi:cyanophycinase-like exopeptidase
MGSGEITPTMVSTHRSGITGAGAEAVTIIDTPFGFQENADELTERIASFFRTSLVVGVNVASVRGNDDSDLAKERAVSEVRRSRYVFAGPGSPSYALRIWKEVGMGEALTSVLTAGGTVTMASAAALTAGQWTLPVYEIYKVGEDPHWLEGLDLATPLGLPMVVIPHWNNSEGGTHDTSRCYVGERRLRAMEAKLPIGILGIDEHTAASIDFDAGVLAVSGASTVTLRGVETVVLEAGERMDLTEARRILAGARPFGPSPIGTPPGLDFRAALEARDVDAALSAMLDAEAEDDRRSELRSMIVELGEAARTGLVDPHEVVAGFVDLLLELRGAARSARRFEESDLIRDRLADLGIEVRDTRGGAEWEIKE